MATLSSSSSLLGESLTFQVLTPLRTPQAPIRDAPTETETDPSPPFDADEEGDRTRAPGSAQSFATKTSRWRWGWGVLGCNMPPLHPSIPQRRSSLGSCAPTVPLDSWMAGGSLQAPALRSTSDVPNSSGELGGTWTGSVEIHKGAVEIRNRMGQTHIP